MRRWSILAAMAMTAALLAFPSGTLAAGSLHSVAVFPDSVRDGASSQGTVNLAFTDPEPTVIKLFSSDPSVASVPATVTVPPGASSANFTIATNATAPDTIVSITAWDPGGASRSANLWVNAATPAGPSLAALSFAPSSLTGGSASTGTVRFSAAMSNGAVVQLSSAKPAVVQVPTEVVVDAGKSTGAFPITTSPVSATTTAVVTARWFGVTRTATMTVTPGAPAAADKVAIKSARWSKGLLQIEATSTNPNAILNVHSRSGGYMATMNNNGGGRYSLNRPWVDNPQFVSVRSNFGGSASANLTK
jgi:hypothetical protein